MKIITGLPPKIPKGKPVALDVELFHAERAKLHRPTGKFACLSICFDPKVVYLVEKQSDVSKALRLVKDGLWIFHNAMFDIFHLRRWTRVGDVPLWDTLLIEKALFAGYYDSFELKDLARRWLDIEMRKEDVKLFAKADEMDQQMRRYTAEDVRVTLLIQQKQLPLYPKVKKLYEEIDRPALFATLRFNGMYMDQKAWRKLAEKNQSDTDIMAEDFDFNPNSPKQALEALQKSGLGSLESTNEKKLKHHSEHKLAKNLLKYRKSAKLARTYGLNFLDKVEEDGRLYASFNIIGAVTGRFSSSKPNFQNIPARRGKEFRDCFVAPRGRRLIIADYGQQEPRINAAEARDEKMISLFKEGGSIYIKVAREVFGKEITKKDVLYKHMKAIVLGLSYGLSEKGLAEQLQITERQAKRLIRRYLLTFPRQRMHMDRIRRSAVTSLTVRGGRQIAINPYSFSRTNQSLDYPAQGGAANVTKLAEKYIDRGIRKLDAFIVNIIHDEFVVESSAADARKVARVVQESMLRAAHELVPEVPAEAEVFIGTKWSDKDDEKKKIRFGK